MQIFIQASIPVATQKQKAFGNKNQSYKMNIKTGESNQKQIKNIQQTNKQCV